MNEAWTGLRAPFLDSLSALGEPEKPKRLESGTGGLKAADGLVNSGRWLFDRTCVPREMEQRAGDAHSSSWKTDIAAMILSCSMVGYVRVSSSKT